MQSLVIKKLDQYSWQFPLMWRQVLKKIKVMLLRFFYPREYTI